MLRFVQWPQAAALLAALLWFMQPPEPLGTTCFWVVSETEEYRVPVSFLPAHYPSPQEA